MQLMLIIIGGLIGIFFASGADVFFRFGAGAALGYLLGQPRSLQDKVKELSDQVERSIAGRPPAQPVVRPPEPEQAVVRPVAEAPVASAPAELAEKAAGQPEPRSLSAEPQAASPGLRFAEPIARMVELAKRWLTTGNVPVKLGIIVSFFGVAFLFAVRQPPKLRGIVLGRSRTQDFLD